MLAGPAQGQQRYDVSQFWDESLRFVAQPVHWGTEDWLTVAAVGAGTALFMPLDQPVRDVVLRHPSAGRTAAADVGNAWGGGYVSVAAAAAFGLHGLIAGDQSTRKVGFEIVQSALYAGGITTALKMAIGRARPSTGVGSATYRAFTLGDDAYHSLPSGHTTLAFALSGVLSRNARSTEWKVLAYLPAALTVFARVSGDRHWTSDCFLGGAIGYAAATWSADLHEDGSSSVRISSVFPLTVTVRF